MIDAALILLAIALGLAATYAAVRAFQSPPSPPMPRVRPRAPLYIDPTALAAFRRGEGARPSLEVILPPPPERGGRP